MQPMETISRGAQFKGIISLLGLIIFPFTLTIAIVLFVNAAVVPGLCLLIISAAAFFLFLDVRGVQIDLANRRVRNYKQYIIWKYGEWMPLDVYTGIQLAKDTVYLRHLQPGRAGMLGSGSSASRISTYDVALVSDDQEQVILLSEFEKHHDAVAFMQKYAALLSLPMRDIYSELQQSAQRRRNSRR
jgi:hypothetical protein